MIRSRSMTGFIWLVLTLALHLSPAAVAPLRAQGSRKDDIVFNSRGVPLAGASVRVCAMPATGQPCTPLALIYSDVLLTQALANPTTTDGLGNYSFYAAPGKYELEFSGPGITTKQVPNVILPSDPSSPTFPGNISAFSLNLTGNLTVNGNTVIVGSFASGLLNLTNQSTPPGTAGSGTVNLYTKTADKRLYYKDDTGAEIGPIASSSGAQTNVANTFTAPQNIDADFHTKGPNPDYDVTRFGGYIGPNYYNGSTGFTTGSISAGTAALTVASALDFVNGNGILILGAGAAPTIGAPSGITAAPAQVLGSSTRVYAVVAEDWFGGRVPSSTSGTVTTAAATLGLQTATLTACARASGVVTCSTSAAHNFQPGAQVEIQRSTTADPSFEGAFTLTSASGSTFTFNQYNVPDASGTVTFGTARVSARVVVKWNAPTSNTVLRNYIYVCTSTCTLPANAANFALEGVSMGNDSYFLDVGYSTPVSAIGNGDVPSTLQTSASNRWFSTTIATGGGTTLLTLAASATSTASGQRVLHDNTPNLVAACNAFPFSGASLGGVIYVPGSTNATYQFPIASTFNMSSCPGQTEIDFAATTWLTGTIIPKAYSKLKGLAPGNHAQSVSFYGLSTNGVITGLAYPLFYENPSVSHDLSFETLTIIGNQAYQVLVYQDQDTIGEGIDGIRYEDVHLEGGNYTTSLVTKGGFGFFWERGGWTNNALDFSGPPSSLFTTNCGTGQSGAVMPYILYTNHTYVFGGGILFDTCGAALTGNIGMVAMEFRDMIMESSAGPIVRVNSSGTYAIGQVDFYRLSYADYTGGASTPLIDLTNGVASAVRAIQPSCADGYQPLFEVSTSTSAYIGLEEFRGGEGSCSYFGANTGLIHDGILNAEVFNSWSLALTGSGRLTVTQMANPAVPQSVVASGSGSVPAQAWLYTFTASDFDGGETTLGPGLSVTPNGTQLVTVTAPATFPPGASGVNAYRNGRLINANSCFKPQLTTPGGTLVDSTSFDCGSAQPSTNTASVTSTSANGVTSNKFRINGEALTASPRGEQNIFLPGALTSTWTGSTWTTDKAVTITRVQVQAKTAPATCSTNAIVRVTDGTTPINVTIAAAGNDSGALTQSYAAGAVITTSVQTAAAGCATSPADANVSIQYKMQ